MRDISWCFAKINDFNELKSTHRINDATQPLEDEDRGAIIIQIVPLRSFDAHSHERFGLRLRSYKRKSIELILSLIMQ